MRLTDDPSPKSPQTEESPKLRAPTRREQTFAAIAFTVVAAFFVVWFVIWFDRKYHWLLLALAVLALIRAARHAMAARKIS